MRTLLDILFVYPPTGWTAEAMHIAENDAPPLGLLYVAAAARQGGSSVAVIDMNHPPMDADGLAALVAERQPGIVAFSVLTPSSGIVKALIAVLKTRCPGVHLVAGGIHPTVLPADLLNAGLDCVVVGEGEATIVELATATSAEAGVAEVAGLVYRGGWLETCQGDVQAAESVPMRATSRRPPCDDLDSLPRPARDLLPILDYGQPGAICTSRGCPYACSFCSSVLSGGHKYRLRSVDSVMEEIGELHDQFRLSRFQFLDDNFAAAPGHADALAARLLGQGYLWSCQTSVMELVDQRHLLTRMHEAGCREIYFGLESGSRRILAQYKSIDLDRAKSVLAHAASLGRGSGVRGKDLLQTVVGFMVGHPDDDEESIEDTVQLALEMRRMGIDTMLGVMQPYPGSQLHRDPGRYGVVVEGTDFSQYLYPKANMATRRLSRQQISALYARGLLRILDTY